MLLAARDVPAQQAPKITYAPAENVSPANAPEMFRNYCAPCHGADGRGGGPAAPALKTAPADLTQISRRNGGKFPVFRVANVIRGYDAVAAHGSREMPVWGSVFRAFGDELSVKLRVDNLTSYLETLQGK
jgi:mono/diheme cytochrome c family protein